jgi:hypothetical protein
MSKKRESHKQALRQLIDRYFGTPRHPCDAIRATREQLIDEILSVNDRFTNSPAWLDEALNSGDGSYEP